MTIYNVTTASNLTTTIAGMSAGDWMVLAPGTYTVSTTLYPTNGTFIVGMPGAIMTPGANVDLFHITNQGGGSLNLSNIYISGITFQGSGTYAPPNACIYYVSATGCTFSNNTFSGVLGTSNCIQGLQSNSMRIDDNKATNCYQFLSVLNGATTAVSGLSVSGNFLQGLTGVGIGVKINPGSGYPFYNALHVNNNTVIDAQNISISLVGVTTAGVVSTNTDCTVIGNDIWGATPAGIELCVANSVAAYNRFTGVVGGFEIGQSGNCLVYGNVFRNTGASGSFSKDSGWTGTAGQSQWVGVNMINGVATTGWSGVGNDPNITPPTFSPVSTSSLLTEFQDGQPNGSIVPVYVRNFIGSLPLGPTSSWNIYP